MDERALTLYRLVEVKDKDKVDGPVACAVKHSRISLEEVERVMAENQRLRRNLQRTSESLWSLSTYLDNLEEPAAGASPESASEEVRVLRAKLRASYEIRKECQQMLNAMRSEFRTLTRAFQPVDAGQLGAAVAASASSPEAPPAKPVTYSAVATFDIDPKAKRAPSLPKIIFKVISADDMSEEIALPSPSGNVARFEFQAPKMNVVDELWLWRDGATAFHPVALQSIVLTRGKRTWTFHCEGDADDKSKVVRLPAS